MTRLFVPGFGALPSLYEPALADGWTVHEPPSFRRAASLDSRLAALRRAVDRHAGPLTLAGHSMGAALAVGLALEQPERVERLVLVAPAGLPLTKPMAQSVRDFCAQTRDRVYTPRQVWDTVRGALAAPRSTLGLARAVRGLNLGEQLGVLARRGIRCEVIGCVGDTLTPVGHCREIARLAGADYREVDAAGGHMWMVVEPDVLTALLAD
jgi:pimeloyl-ACP methyl ester carboxylesterase